ncbi:piggyBac transposable element-derived protein 3 [Ixodes scapularis]
MASNTTAAAGFLTLPCSSFYARKSHEKTGESAGRLLERIANGDVSDVGESDEEDDTFETNACQTPEQAYDLENEEAAVEDANEDEESTPDVPCTSVIWKKKRYTPPQDTGFSARGDFDVTADETSTPLTYFSRYVPQSVFKGITEATNEYSVLTSHTNVNTSPDEVWKLVGMHVLMGVISLPRVRLYWDNTAKVPLISETMTPKRFFKLRNNLHIAVSEPSDCQDKLWKVRPFLDSIRARCLDLQLEEEVSVDEQMIPFKGKLSIKQYMRGKPTPWGVKVFALCGRSGQLYDFVIYQGQNSISDDLKKAFGLCSGVVLHLAQRIPLGCNYQLYFDNYFTSIPLLRRLKKDGILAAGTVRTNRLAKCPISGTKAMKKSPRGYSEECVTQDDIVAVSWKDNNCVTIASNFVGIGEQKEVSRWDKEKKQHILVKQPEVIKKYNQSMGGVDKLDFLLSLYRIKIRSRKWTLRVLFHFVDIAICNAWLEYLRDNEGIPRTKLMDLMHFRLQVAEGLIKAVPNARKRGRPSLENLDLQAAEATKVLKKPRMSRPCADSRYDCVDHWPEARNQAKPSRCKLENCKGRSRIFCKKCAVPLCLTKERNCFFRFHV